PASRYTCRARTAYSSLSRTHLISRPRVAEGGDCAVTPTPMLTRTTAKNALRIATPNRRTKVLRDTLSAAGSTWRRALALRSISPTTADDDGGSLVRRRARGRAPSRRPTSAPETTRQTDSARPGTQPAR